MTQKFNNLLRSSMMVLAIFLLASCDKGFQEINKSVDFVSDPNPDFVLPAIELNMLDRTYYTQGDFIAPIVGHVTQGKTYASLTSVGGNHGYHFEWVYQNPLKSVTDLIDRTKEDPEKVNYTNIGRIIKAYLFHQLTDVYGDIPYFEANKGYSDQIFTPKYDAQQLIYMDLFKELDEASLALNASKPTPKTADLVYKGDVQKWKKFANSLMLRLGLRIMKADPANGEKWIKRAMANGVMTSNDDNFVVLYKPSSYYGSTQNGQPHIFVRYFNNYRYSEPFVNFLKSKNDPRISVYLSLPGSTASYMDGDKTPSKQKGYPMFGNIAETRNNFSVTNINTFGRYDAPYIHLSYAQVQLNLAECAVRGIIIGDAKTYYENGVKAAMDELKVYGAQGVVAPAKAAEYLAANPYDPTTEAALEMINTQYWLETHVNYYETFANMRRSGYPKIYTGFTDGSVLPRRLTYAPSDVSINPNVQEAIKRQGADLVTTKVWWDK